MTGTAPEDAQVVQLRREHWRVADVAQADARVAIECWHYAQGCPNTSVARHGLFNAFGTELKGVAMWLPPTPPAGKSVAGENWRGVLNLTRLVIAPDVPSNGASFLLGTPMRLVDRARWPVLLTYADTALGHTGAIYRATNWECLGETAAGDTWVGPNGEQRGRKRGGKNLSAAEMRELGFERRPAAPKIKFVHRLRRGAVAAA